MIATLSFNEFIIHFVQSIFKRIQRQKGSIKSCFIKLWPKKYEYQRSLFNVDFVSLLSEASLEPCQTCKMECFWKQLIAESRYLFSQKAPF